MENRPTTCTAQINGSKNLLTNNNTYLMVGMVGGFSPSEHCGPTNCMAWSASTVVESDSL